MSKFPIELKAGVELGWIKKTTVTEKKDFPECTTKEKEFGTLRKWLWYIHREGKHWYILQVKPELKSFILK